MELTSRDSIWLLTETHSSLHCCIAGRNAIDFKQDEPLREREKSLLSGLSGIGPESIHFLRQVHGDTILPVPTNPNTGNRSAAGEGDALITSRPGEVLVIRTADCIPVMIFDPEIPILAMVHSGWRSTRLNITGKVLDLMKNRFGSDPAVLQAAILPGIGPDSYEVREDVAKYFPDHIRPSGDAFLLDLPGAIADQVLEQGIPKNHLFNSGRCTLKENVDFFSHRKGDRGRNLNYAWFDK